MSNILFLFGMLFCIYALTVIILIILMNKKDKQFAIERKDYIDRIMAKDTREYIKLSTKDGKKTVLSDREILDEDFEGMLN